MATITSNFEFIGTIRCGGPNGESIKQGSIVNIIPKTNIQGLPTKIRGVVQSVTNATFPPIYLSSAPRAGIIVAVSYDTDLLNGVLLQLEQCNIETIECLTCCEILEEKILALEARVAALE